MRQVPDFRKFLQHSESQLLLHLANLQQDIANVQQEIGLVESEKIKVRCKAYVNSDSRSAATRTQEADVASVTLTTSELSLRAEYASMLEEKFFIIRLLDAFNHNSDTNFN